MGKGSNGTFLKEYLALVDKLKRDNKHLQFSGTIFSTSKLYSLVTKNNTQEVV